MSDTVTNLQQNAATLSANKPEMARTDLPDDDTVTLIIDNQKLQNWQSLSITRGIEVMPPVCDLVLSFSNPPPKISIPDFAPCQLYVGQDKLITGYVRRTSYSISTRAHEVHLSIGGKTQDLLECNAITADLKQVLLNQTFKTIAEDLCQPFGITVIQTDTDDGPAIPSEIIPLGSRPWDILDECARFARKIIYEDESGNLLLAQVGTDHMASGFVEGGNIEEASAQFDCSIRYSDYIAAYMSVDQLSELGPAGTLQSDFQDSTVTRFRPYISISPQANLDGDLAIQMAKYEFARRVGRSQVVRVVVKDWRDSAGKLWTINNQVIMALPSINVAVQTWLIAEVTFTRNLKGQRATVTLMPPSAFTIAPSTIGAIGADLDKAIRTGTTPGASTSTTGAEPSAQPSRPTITNDDGTTTTRVNTGDTSTNTSGTTVGGTRVYLPGLGPL